MFDLPREKKQPPFNPEHSGYGNVFDGNMHPRMKLGIRDGMLYRRFGFRAHGLFPSMDAGFRASNSNPAATRTTCIAIMDLVARTGSSAFPPRKQIPKKLPMV